MRHHIALAAVTVFVVLCRTVTADDLARVFVYSQRETPARSWKTIACDGERIAEVKRGFFFAVNVRPGRHSLSLVDGVPISVEGIIPLTKVLLSATLEEESLFRMSYRTCAVWLAKYGTSACSP